MEHLPINRALISVTDKSGREDLWRGLSAGGTEIISTGGTMKKIQETGIPVTSVSEVTGFPEIMGGRVKTLHPFIHAGVLADKDSSSHMQTLQEMGLKTFDLICVNLYEFENALDKGLETKDLVEEIDIGGPTLLRAGAKNFHSIAVLPDPQFYTRFLQELKQNNHSINLDFRKEMAAYTFKRISQYDATIGRALS